MALAAGLGVASFSSRLSSNSRDSSLESLERARLMPLSAGECRLMPLLAPVRSLGPSRSPRETSSSAAGRSCVSLPGLRIDVGVLGPCGERAGAGGSACRPKTLSGAPSPPAARSLRNSSSRLISSVVVSVLRPPVPARWPSCGSSRMSLSEGVGCRAGTGVGPSSRGTRRTPLSERAGAPGLAREPDCDGPSTGLGFFLELLGLAVTGPASSSFTSLSLARTRSSVTSKTRCTSLSLPALGADGTGVAGLLCSLELLGESMMISCSWLPASSSAFRAKSKTSSTGGLAAGVAGPAWASPS